MSMSRKHFVDLADALALNKPDRLSDAAGYDQWEKIVNAVACVCNKHNTNFDFGRFYNACGVEDEE